MLRIAWVALVILVQASAPCVSCGKANKKAGACPSCKFDASQSRRGYFVGMLSKDLQVSDGFTTAQLVAPDAKKAQLKSFIDKRVRVQGLSKGSDWAVSRIDEASSRETDLVFRGKIKNAGGAACLRAGLCQEGTAEPLFVCDVQGTEYVVRGARGPSGKDHFYAVIWDDKDRDGLPNEAARTITPTFHFRNGKWTNSANELIESPVTVEVELP